jgi:capsular polysaccharide transport system permease protein
MTDIAAHAGRSHQENPFKIQLRVIGALILRDMRTRFGRTFFGWVIMVLWPLTHLGFLLGGYVLVHHIAPIGTDVTVFAGTGILPYILCLYPARMIMLCLVQNQPLLLFPIVSAIDIVIARTILEIINAFWVVCIFCLVLYIAGIPFLPRDYTTAILAVLATIYLGFSIGFFSALMLKIARLWIAVQIGALIVAYILSGAFVPISFAPAWAQDLLWFNPLLHCVEWLRSAYYDSFGESMLSRTYLLGYSTVTLAGALILERAMRGLLLMQR